jgi:hypothetical protein
VNDVAFEECVEVTVELAAAGISTLILPGRLLQSQVTSSRLMLPFMVCLAHQNIWLSVTEHVCLRRFHRKFEPAYNRRLWIEQKQDFGVWNISYQMVSCQEWEGYSNQTALGSVADLGYTSCCPNNPVLFIPFHSIHANGDMW